MAKSDKWKGKDSGGMGYFLGFIGALVYFFQDADTFWLIILAFLKAIVWPAYLVYRAFDFIG